MTGDNSPMVHMRTLTSTPVDAAATTSYSWTCADVTPYSTIYFYQFTSAKDLANVTWTGRFALTGADGTIVAPEHTSVENGNTVNWGTGAFVDASLYNAQPTYATALGQIIGGASNSSSSSSSSGGSSASSASSASSISSASSVSAASSASSPAASSGSPSSKITTVTSASHSGATGSSSGPSPTSTNKSNGAGASVSPSSIVSWVVLAGAALFGGFAVTL